MIRQIKLKDMSFVPSKDDTVRIVMFYGETCGPCKSTMPHYEKVAADFTRMGTKIQFHRIHAWDKEEQKDIEQQWQVKGVPTFKAFVNGEVLLDKVGGGDEAEMLKITHQLVDDAFKKYGLKV